MAELDSLSIKVEVDAAAASNGLNDLARTMQRLKSSINNNYISVMSGLSNALRGFSGAVGDSPKKLNDVASALSNLGSAAKSVNASAALGNNISAIAHAVKLIDPATTQRLTALGNGLTALGKVGKVSLPAGLDATITSVATAANSVDPMTMIKLQNLAKGLSYLANVGNISIRSDMGDAIRNIASAAGEVNPGTAAGIKAFADSLKPLEEIGNITLGGALGQFGKLPGAMKALDSIDMPKFAEGVNMLADALERLAGLENLGSMASVLSALKGMGYSLRGPSGNGAPETPKAPISPETVHQPGGTQTGKNDVPTPDDKENTDNLSKSEEQLATSTRKAAAAGKEHTNVLSALGSTVRHVASAIWGMLAPLRELAGKALSTLGSAAKSAASGFGTLVKSSAMLPVMFGKQLAGSIGKTVGALRGLMRQFARVAMMRAIRSIIRQITAGFQEGIKNLYAWSKAMDGTFANSMNTMATAAQYVKNSLGAMASPLINTVAPAIDYVADKFVDLLNLINQFIARLTGASTYTAAKKAATTWGDSAAKSASGAKKAADDLKRTLLSFDEINKLNGQDSSGSGGGSGSGSGGVNANNMFETREIAGDVSSFADELKAAFMNQEWAQIGQIFARELNRIVDGIDFGGIGKKVGGAINAGITAYYSFMSDTDFTAIGQGIGDFLNRAIEQIDFGLLGQAMVVKISSAIDVGLGAIGTLDFGAVGTSFGNFTRGIYDEITDWFGKYDWGEIGTTIWTKITDAVSGFKLLESMVAFSRAFGTALRGGWNLAVEGLLGSDFLSVLKDQLPKGINTFIEEINSTITDQDWGSVGASLTDTLMESVLGIDWRLVGATLANVVNHVLDFIGESIRNLEKNAGNLGVQLGNAINAFIGDVKWSEISETFNSLFHGAIDFSVSFLQTFNATEIGNNLRKMLFSVDWNGIAQDIWNFLKLALNKAGDFITALLDFGGDSLGRGVGKLANKFNIGNLISDALGGTKSVFGVFQDVAYALLNAINWAIDHIEWAKLGAKFGDALKKGIMEIEWYDLFEKMWETFKKAFAGLSDFVGTAIFGEKTWAKIAPMYHAVTGFVSDNTLIPGAGLGLAANNRVMEMVSGRLNGETIMSDISGIPQKANDIWNSFLDGAADALDWYNTTPAHNSVQNWFNNTIDTIEGWFTGSSNSPTVRPAPGGLNAALSNADINWGGGTRAYMRNILLALRDNTAANKDNTDVISEHSTIPGSGISSGDATWGVNISGGNKLGFLGTTESSTASANVKVSFKPGDGAGSASNSGTPLDWLKNIMQPGTNVAVGLAKSGWSTLKQFAEDNRGGIASELLGLAKSGWSTLKAYAEANKGGNANAAVALAKTGWSTLKAYAEASRGGNASAYVALAKNGWSTLKAYAEANKGGTASEALSLLKSGWSTLKAYTESHKGGVANEAIGLTKHGWTTLESYVTKYRGSIPDVKVDLLRSNWNSMGDWAVRFGQYANLKVNLVKGNISTGFNQLLALMNIRLATGGVIQGGAVKRFAAGGTAGHGTMFMAGEAGPEIIGNINGRTEILNKSQIAAAMYAAVRTAMSAAYTTTYSGYATNEDDEDMTALIELVRRGSEATERQNDLIRQQNDYLRQINDKEFGGDYSTSGLTQALNRKNRRAGTAIVPIGT